MAIYSCSKSELFCWSVWKLQWFPEIVTHVWRHIFQGTFNYKTQAHENPFFYDRVVYNFFLKWRQPQLMAKCSQLLPNSLIHIIYLPEYAQKVSIISPLQELEFGFFRSTKLDQGTWLCLIHFDNFWLIWIVFDHIRPVWTIMDHFKTIWDQFWEFWNSCLEPICSLMDHIVPYWTIVDHCTVWKTSEEITLRICQPFRGLFNLSLSFTFILNS